MMQGEIKEGRGGIYTVRDEQGQEHVLRAKKRFRREGLSPLPGDRVMFTPRFGEEHGWLEEILPRVSLCLRPPVANIRRMAIVVAEEPIADWLLVDKLLIQAHRQDIEPLLVVNKCDLGNATYEEAQRAYRGADIPVLAVSAETGQGMEELRQALEGELSCLAGQSGVGKSALLSELTGEDLVSGALSAGIGRGKQTTRHTTLLYKDGLKVLDTPGFSLLDLPKDLPPEELWEHYPEFLPLAPDCRFKPCLHDTEPGCAVRQALKVGDIDPGRYSRYQELLNLSKTAWRDRYA